MAKAHEKSVGEFLVENDHVIENPKIRSFSRFLKNIVEASKEKNIVDLIEKLVNRGFLISNGYGKLKEKTFRIGHMGEWTLPEIKMVLDIIDDLWGLEK